MGAILRAERVPEERSQVRGVLSVSFLIGVQEPIEPVPKRVERSRLLHRSRSCELLCRPLAQAVRSGEEAGALPNRLPREAVPEQAEELGLSSLSKGKREGSG